MNLGKLLGAGKSFFDGSGSVSYRENKRAYLPKFNAGKNPFTPKPAEDAPAAVPEVKKITVPVAAKTQKIPVLSAAGPARAVSWKDKLNPFRAPGPVRLAPPSAVQAELSLEAVKVVHNDLADADIEIVPVKSRPAAAPPAPALSPERAAWGFSDERLVKQI